MLHLRTWPAGTWPVAPRRMVSLAFAAALAICLIVLSAGSGMAQGAVRPPANAVGNAGPAERVITTPEKGGSYDIELWQKLRQGVRGSVSIPDKKAGVLVQSGGEGWRLTRRGELPRWGGYALGGMLALLALFFLVRGRIRVDGGLSGIKIERFENLERVAHWLMAVSFIILGLTGLNVLYGREVLMPILGKEAFAGLSVAAKWLHNYVAFAFVAGLILSFVVWVRHNFPNQHDVVWLARAGGMLSKHSHPPARKFNAGQKILFWLVMLGGLSLALSGLSLMLPFEFALFSKTFSLLNAVGFNLPTNLSAVEEMQYAATWHSIMALFLICVIFAHIYIGTIGMEGAFDAMGSGEVDLNWAKEHHSVWVEEELDRERMVPRGSTGGRIQPAE